MARIKQYTDQELVLDMTEAASLLALTTSIVVTIKNGTTALDITPTVDGGLLTVTLTNAQTAQLSGKCDVEVTGKADGKCWKSETVHITVDNAVKKAAL